MLIRAKVLHSPSSHTVEVRTGDSVQSVAVPGKANGSGSSINGGEFLLLAVATCYCNDLYREAERLRIALTSVEVEATAEFPGIGLAATRIRYRAKIDSPEAPERIAQLLRETDAVAEVHNTVRVGVPVELVLD